MRAIGWPRSVIMACVAVLLSAPAWAGSPAVQGVWVQRHVHYVYQGFTTLYSCGGLRDEIETLLTRLGARHLKIVEDPCVRPGRPNPFPGVRVTMQVLVPAGPKDPAAARVAAHWHKVDLTREGADFNRAGKCDLIAQFRRKFLPLFAARNIHLRADCVPHQIMSGTYLDAEVLRPDAPPAKHP